MANSKPVEFQLWHYRPSIAAGVVGCLAFLSLSSIHSWRLLRTRLWFCVPFVVGGLFEMIGYAARAAAADDMTSIAPYVIQSLLILLAPILFAASIYMILGRLIRATRGSALSMVRLNWLTKIFVGGDAFCFLMQSTGGGLLAKAESQDDVDMGENIILGGLVLQILIFSFFVVVAAVFHRRLAARPTPESYSLEWQRYLWILYTMSGLITVRNIARCAEYGMGRDGYLLQHEWCLYVYDFCLMFACLGISLACYKLVDLRGSLRQSDGEMHPLPRQIFTGK